MTLGTVSFGLHKLTIDNWLSDLIARLKEDKVAAGRYAGKCRLTRLRGTDFNSAKHLLQGVEPRPPQGTIDTLHNLGCKAFIDRRKAE